jgi:hypothetical protein
MEEVEELKEAFESNMSAKISSIRDEINKKNTIKVTGFIKTALNGPFIVKKQNGRDEKLTEDEYLDFVSNLLRFWSGWNHFKETDGIKYTINVMDTYGTDRLPTSHTCFYQIDMPPYDDLQTCLDKLYMVVYNVESGIGLAGGSKSRRKKWFTMSILNKKIQKHILSQRKLKKK